MYLSKSADIAVATKRIMWGKFMNSGQTCVAPDFLMCTQDVRDEFVRVAKQVVLDFCGGDPKASPDLARIVSERQFLYVCGRVSDFHLDYDETFFPPRRHARGLRVL